jgi:hypothetical protein
MSLEMLLQDIVISKMSLHCNTLQDALKNVSIVLVTLYFEDIFHSVTKI